MSKNCDWHPKVELIDDVHCTECAEYHEATNCIKCGGAIYRNRLDLPDDYRMNSSNYDDEEVGHIEDQFYTCDSCR